MSFSLSFNHYLLGDVRLEEKKKELYPTIFDPPNEMPVVRYMVWMEGIAAPPSTTRICPGMEISINEPLFVGVLLVMAVDAGGVVYLKTKGRYIA